MPELPGIELYLECLRPRVQGQVLERVRLANPFLLLVFALEPDLFLVLHLMIAGRLYWKPWGAKAPGKID
jgi:formamidopyrimidine-DNA glycosylase